MISNALHSLQSEESQKGPSEFEQGHKRETFRFTIVSQQRRMFPPRKTGMLFQRKKKVRSVKVTEMRP